MAEWISSAALAISIVTFYWTTLRRARLVVPVPRVLAFIRGEGDGHYVATTLFIANMGARPANVGNLYARLKHPDGEVSMNWIAESRYRAITEDAEFRISQETAPSAFSLEQHGFITKHLVFQVRGDSVFPEGESTIEFLAELIGRRRPCVMTSRRVRLFGTLGRGKSVEQVTLRFQDGVDEIHLTA